MSPLSKAQFKAVEKFAKTTGKQTLGTSHLLVDHKKRAIWMGTFYPFGEAHEGEPPRRLGIGSAVKRAVVSYLLKKHGNYLVIEAALTSAGERHRRALGIKPHESPTLKVYKTALDQYLKRKATRKK